jgi:2,4-dichlorophenol 6-monooxygenase
MTDGASPAEARPTDAGAAGGFDVDVLVVGAGPMGATTAALLAKAGVRVRMISMFPWVANTPRAHITSQRAMEVLRDLGVEHEVTRVGTPWDQMGECPLAISLAGPEIARMPSWGAGFDRHGDYIRNSPSTYLDVPQPLMEPILIGAAARHGAQVAFNTEFLSLTQDTDGVTATVVDHTTGVTSTVRCRYLVGADGARSRVVEQIGLPIEGHVARAGTVYTQFRADLSRYVAHRPSTLFWLFNPVGGFGEIGLGLLRAITPWNEWISGWGFNLADGDPDLSHETLVGRIRQLVGDPDLEPEIIRSAPWYVNQQYATTWSDGRVFCGGDAVHRHPPSSGLGSNTCIQDAHNLAWKLAYVIHGHAGAGLLESYTPERAPVGKQVVLRANQSRLDYAAIRACLITDGDGDPTTNALHRLKAATPEGVELRERLEEALQLKEHEWNAEGVEKNARYTSGAVITEPDAEVFDRDVELFAQITTRPGARLPHAWLIDGAGVRISTLDLVGDSQTTVVTGLAGRAWQQAVTALAHPWLRCVVIGEPGAQDVYHSWHRIREVHDAGAVLVRPDGYIAWRHHDAVWEAATATALLADVLDRVLDRTNRQESA